MASRRLPSLLALRAFEAAARRLSFTDAARELHVSQAAVSRHVRSLETDIGTGLFRRLHRRVELTQTGERLAGELTAGFVRIRRAVETARGVTRRLRLAVEPAFASRWLVQRLGRFAAAHPQIELELETSDELRVLGRDADIAIRFVAAGARRHGSRARRLFAIDGVPVIAGRAARPRDWQQDAAVRGHRLLHDDDGRAWRSWFATARLDGFERAQHQYFSDYSLAVAAAQQGQGLVLGAPAFIEPELRSGRLVRLGRTRVAFGTYWLLESRERSSAGVRAPFVRWLMAEIAALTARAGTAADAVARQ
jgi:LysR family transcriptional regulator, glycine cleavage system transcriptional activator